MKTSKYLNIFSNKWVKGGLLLLLGFFLGWIFFHPTGNNRDTHEHSTEASQATIWTCAMHPQIRMDKPGKCPICGMDLVPLVKNGSSSIDPDAIQLSKEAAALANVLTTKVSKQNPVKEVRLYGKVEADERLFQNQVSHVPGRIEKLFVNFTGELVSKGQKLAEIYSPQLVNAQQELLETIKTKQLQPELYEASKEKLRQWKLTENQIESIENSGKIINNFEVLSNTSGTVVTRFVSAGDYVSYGTNLFEITDLSNVWLLFDAYESDIPFLRMGDRVKFSIQAMPGYEFSGNIVFIDPVIDPVTRVAKVRVETSNPSGRLKPEMFATGIVSSHLKEYNNNIVIPRSAVLWTGKRSIVYVKDPDTDEPVFMLREINLGPILSEGYVVTDGLAEGEEIVTQGAFSVDAAAQLEGKQSMMNPKREKSNSSTPGLIMPGGPESEITDEMPGMTASDKTGNTANPPVDIEFKRQLSTVFDHYLTLKNYLVQDNSKSASEAAKNLGKAISDVDTKKLSGDANLRWMDLSDRINESLSLIIISTNLEQERFAFQSLSKDLHTTIKSFGLLGKTVYYQFCPMFDNNKGAYWLSEKEEILNPYYGKEMLTCGETKETLKYK